MTYEFVTNQAAYTGTERNHQTYSNEPLYMFANGDFGASGVVKAELKAPNGTWRSFPDTEMTTEGAKQIHIPRGQVWRLVIVDCVSVNVEVA